MPTHTTQVTTRAAMRSVVRPRLDLDRVLWVGIG